MANDDKTINTCKKNKLTILFIPSDKFPPFRVDSSVLFGKEMVGRGHAIDWILQSDNSCEKSYQTIWSESQVWVGKTDNGEKLYNRLRKHYYWILHQLKFISLLQSSKYDFIQVKNKFIIAFAAIIGSRLYRTKFTYWLSYPFPEASLYKARDGSARYPLLYLIRGYMHKILLYKIIAPFAHHVFVQSEQMKINFIKMGIPDSKLTAVPMGISLSEFNPIEINKKVAGVAGIDISRKSIVYLGTLAQARKMGFMIRVLSLVLKKEAKTNLYFVGGGDCAEDIDILEKEALDLGVNDSLVITGFLPREQALVYVNDADVCVSPIYPNPIYDCSSPTKLVEYMAMERPIVANDNPDQKLLMEQSHSGICVPYDEKAFAEAILEIYNHPEETFKMRKCGRKYVEEYRDYKKIADLVEQKYYEILYQI